MLPSVSKRARMQALNDDQQAFVAEPGGSGDSGQIPDPDTLPAGFTLTGIRSLQQQGPLPSSSHQQFPQFIMNPFLDIAAARKALPYLHDQPDDYLSSQSYGDLVRANATLAKADQNSALTALDKRMAANFRELKTKPIRIEAGWDDSLSQLHPARFIQGPACTLNKLWQTARETIPEAGYRPIASYDMESIGLGANASTKGLAEMHFPGSPHQSIKYFLAANMTLSEKAITQGKQSDITVISIEDQLADPANIGELRQALLAASEAQRLITPWNFSISAIQGFMVNTNFCAVQLNNRQDRLVILRRFIDRCIAINAAHWRSGQDFLTASDIASLWQNWSLQWQPMPASQSGGRPSGGGPGPSAGAVASSGSSQRKFPDKQQARNPFRNICRRFNSPAGCPTKGPSCEVGSGNRKFQLQHLCLESVGPDICCLKPHSQQDHGKSTD